jgi:hypothetical protein
MFCPQCGQQQISGETRFCSRCGFPLGGVLSLLATGGIPAQLETSATPKKLSPRSRGYRQGALMLLIGCVLTPILGILTDIGFPEIIVAITAVICFMGGFARMIYARIFEEKTAQQATGPNLQTYVPPVAHTQFGPGGAQPSALPPQRSVPALGWRKQNDTAEVVAPPSVTENTTRLLDEKAEPPRS